MWAREVVKEEVEWGEAFGGEVWRVKGQENVRDERTRNKWRIV